MKQLIMNIVLSLLMVIYVICDNNTFINPYQDFQDYRQHFCKLYNKSESLMRQNIYLGRLNFIQSKNCSKCIITNFTDWTYRQLHNFYQVNSTQINIYDRSDMNTKLLKYMTDITAVSNAFDFKSFSWLKYNKVTTTKNQGNCGSGWAFSITAFLQSLLIIKHQYNNSIDLSQQFLLRCSNRSNGCNGGNIYKTIQFIYSNRGLPTQEKYAYSAQSFGPLGMCISKDLIRIPPVSLPISYVNLTNQSFIQQLVLNKPIIISVCSKSFKDYNPLLNRTLTCTSQQVVDHSVLLIGYTETQWIVKNSWGKTWGIDGIGYISRIQGQNCCVGRQIFTTATVKSYCTILNCEICVRKNACHKCVKGYFVVNIQDIHKCEPYPKKTTSCVLYTNYNGVCDICVENYVLAYPEYNCTQTSNIGCSFANDTNCVQCKLGFVLNNKSSCNLICYESFCRKCNMANCISCSNPSNCTKCEEGYLKQNGYYQVTCILCDIDNCIYCNRPNFCTQCSLGYYRSPRKTFICSINCSSYGCYECIFPTVCINCYSNYIMEANFICSPECNVQNCLNCSQVNICNKCIDPLIVLNYLYLTYCRMNCTDPYCITCTNRSNCTICYQHLYLDKNNTCRFKCNISNCISCKQYNNICLQCSAGYLTKDSICMPRCNYQNSLLISKGNCSKLLDITASINQINFYCIDNCLLCYNNQSCSLCQTPYILQNTTKTCVKCIYNCIKCTNNSKCIQCQINYILSYSSTQCIWKSSNFQFHPQNNLTLAVRCSPGCFQCNSSNVCLVCSLSYVLNGSQCLKCPGECLKCTLINKVLECLQCLKTYQLSGRYCYLKDCLYKKPQPFILCTDCTSLYKLSYYYDFHCEKDYINYCKIYNDTNCFQCFDGYTLNNLTGQCFRFQCIAGCRYCNLTHLDSCISCYPGLYMDNTTCKNCSFQCSTCSSYNICTSCTYGKILTNESKCIKQQIKQRYNLNYCPRQYASIYNCYICSANYQKCQICFGGYKLNDQNKCVQDIQCNKTSSCIVCPSLYYLTHSNNCMSCVSPVSKCLTCPATSPSKCSSCQIFYFLTPLLTCKRCSNLCRTCLSENYCLQCYDGYFLLPKNTGICRLCDKRCSSCEDYPQKCTSCNQGFQLNQYYQCLRTERVFFKISINISLVNYSYHIMNFVDSLRNQLELNRRQYFIIQKVYARSPYFQGQIPRQQNNQISLIKYSCQSTVIQGYLSQSYYNTSQLLDSANRFMQPGRIPNKTINNKYVLILQSQLSSNIQVRKKQQWKPSSSSQIIIILCSVFGALGVLIIIYVVYRIRNRKVKIPLLVQNVKSPAQIIRQSGIKQMNCQRKSAKNPQNSLQQNLLTIQLNQKYNSYKLSLELQNLEC